MNVRSTFKWEDSVNIYDWSDFFMRIKFITMHNTLDYTKMTGHKSAYKNFKTHLSPSQRKGR